MTRKGSKEFAMRNIKSYFISLLFTILLLILTACGEEQKSIVTEDESQKQVLEQVSMQLTSEQPTSVLLVSDEPTKANVTPEPENTSYDFTIGFAGDINLDENWDTTKYMDSVDNGIYDCIDPYLIEKMNSFDYMVLNNEFTYSDRGEPFPGKHYTFRADPSRVNVLKELGVDAVYMANNHAYDWGKDSILDSMDTLDNAGIKRFGAGHNLKEACTPLYVELQGKTIAFVSASRAADIVITPQATEEEPGILHCYEPELFCEVISEAKKNADFVIACVHWGTEYSYELERVQKETGKQYLDAGADVIIGAHPHVLQGLEYYDNKPIFYSLGNYWFNSKTLDTMLVELHFYEDEEGKDILDCRIIPGIQENCQTRYASSKEEQRRIFDFLESHSPNVKVDDEGHLQNSSIR